MIPGGGRATRRLRCRRVRSSRGALFCVVAAAVVRRTRVSASAAAAAKHIHLTPADGGRAGGRTGPPSVNSTRRINHPPPPPSRRLDAVCIPFFIRTPTPKSAALATTRSTDAIKTHCRSTRARARAVCLPLWLRVGLCIHVEVFTATRNVCKCRVCAVVTPSVRPSVRHNRVYSVHSKSVKFGIVPLFHQIT